MKTIKHILDTNLVISFILHGLCRCFFVMLSKFWKQTEARRGRASQAYSLQPEIVMCWYGDLNPNADGHQLE